MVQEKRKTDQKTCPKGRSNGLSDSPISIHSAKKLSKKCLRGSVPPRARGARKNSEKSPEAPQWSGKRKKTKLLSSSEVVHTNNYIIYLGFLKDDIIELFSRFCIHTGQNMGIDVQRCTDVRMPQPMRYYLNVNA